MGIREEDYPQRELFSRNSNAGGSFSFDAPGIIRSLISMGYTIIDGEAWRPTYQHNKGSVEDLGDFTKQAKRLGRATYLSPDSTQMLEVNLITGKKSYWGKYESS